MQKTIQGKRLLKSHTQANLDKRKWNRKQIWMYVELGSRKWLRFIKLKLYSHPPSWCMMFYHLFNVKWNLAHFTPALAHFTPWVVQFPPWLISPRATLLFGDRLAYLDKFKTCARTRPIGQQKLDQTFFIKEHTKPIFKHNII